MDRVAEYLNAIATERMRQLEKEMIDGKSWGFIDPNKHAIRREAELHEKIAVLNRYVKEKEKQLEDTKLRLRESNRKLDAILDVLSTHTCF